MDVPLAALPDWWDRLPPWAVVLVLLAAAALTGWVSERFIVVALRAWARRTVWKADDVLVEALHPSLSIILAVIAFWVGVRYSAVSLGDLTWRILDNLSVTIIILAGAIAASKLVRGLLRLRAQKEARWVQVSLVGSRLGAILVYVVAFLMVIHQYGIEITPILTTLGLAGLAVALALQDTLTNVFSGIWLQTQSSMQPGHYIRLENQKLEGFVEEVGWRTTKIRTLPNNLVVIPNQAVAKETITDYWMPQPRMGTSLTVTTGYEADPERVVPMLLEETLAAADEVTFVLKDPPPAARLNRAADSGWEFWLGFQVPYYYNQWNAQGYVLNRIRKRFAREGIRIPYPIREQVIVEDRADLGVKGAAPDTAAHTDGRGGGIAVGEVHVAPDGTRTIQASK